MNTNANEETEVLRNSAAGCSLLVEESTETHPYDKVKSNHGYSKIKKKGIQSIKTFEKPSPAVNLLISVYFLSAENPYAKVKRSDTMESEPAEVDENETDTDNYDVVYTMRTVDETRKSDSLSVGASADNVSLHPPPLPLPLRGSHSSLASGESANHGPRPPPRGRRSVVLSHSSSNGNINRPNSLISNDQDLVAASDSIDGAAAVVQNDGALEVRGAAAAAAQIHFSGDSQTSQDSSMTRTTLLYRL